MKASREELIGRWRALLQLPEPATEEEAQRRAAEAAALREQIEEAERNERVEPAPAAEIYETQRERKRIGQIKEAVRRSGRDVRFWWNN